MTKTPDVINLVFSTTEISVYIMMFYTFEVWCSDLEMQFHLQKLQFRTRSLPPSQQTSGKNIRVLSSLPVSDLSQMSHTFMC